jgi:hypothetical protein
VQVSWLSLKTKVYGLSVVWPQNHWDGFSQFGLKTSHFGFPGLGLKTGSYDLVVLASKSLRQFLGLGLKTKRATVCRLRHKIEGRMKTAWGTRRDLVACFAWKQVGLGFPSLASRLVVARHKWCTWHHHRGLVEVKPKDRRFDGVGCGAVEVRPIYPSLVVIFLLAHRGILVFWFSL